MVLTFHDVFGELITFTPSTFVFRFRCIRLFTYKSSSNSSNRMIGAAESLCSGVILHTDDHSTHRRTWHTILWATTRSVDLSTRTLCCYRDDVRPAVSAILQQLRLLLSTCFNWTRTKATKYCADDILGESRIVSCLWRFIRKLFLNFTTDVNDIYIFFSFLI